MRRLTCPIQVRGFDLTLSLDSNVLIDMMRGSRPHVRQRLRATVAAAEPVVVSTIVVSELMMGAHLSDHPARQAILLEETIEGLRIEPWTWDDAVATGCLRAERERLGRRLTAFDSQIAGQALARGWTVVTANLRDFWEVEGLLLQDWSHPDEVVSITGGASWFRPTPR